MKRLDKLVFFGNERLATGVSTKAPLLRALVGCGYRPEAVIANYSAPSGRTVRTLEIASVAHAYRIPVFLPGDLAQAKGKIQDIGAQAAILVAYGKIIPQEIIDLFPKGIINLHPSLLPKYRGPTPIETVLLDGAKKTGVSLMRLTKEMDAGPVYARRELELTGNETKQELADSLLKIGADLLIENLPKILDGSLQPTAQDGSRGTYTRLLTKQDGIINWLDSAETIERKIRAHAGFPKSTAKLFDKYDITITKARVAASGNDGNLVIACSPGWLEVTELIAPSGKKISGADFLLGYKP